ncbi:hypothetical protein [Flavobacterium sp.]|uniref:hypothetical protein n=1 Tax=Flavobacterium sp. TaxID=239 RepID=UPI0037510868
MTDISKNAELQQSCITAVKCRFFAQYFGVRVFQNEANRQYNYPNYSYPLTIEKDFNKETNEFLELKPISKITDEDCEFIYQNKKINIDIDEYVYFSKKLANFAESDIYLTDYLRSKSYVKEKIDFCRKAGIEINQKKLDL